MVLEREDLVSGSVKVEGGWKIFQRGIFVKELVGDCTR